MLSFLTSLAFSPIVLSPETITIHEFFISLQRDSQMYKHVYVHIPSCFVHFLDFLNNLRTIKFTPLHCTIQWFCISQGIVQPSWSGGLPSMGSHRGGHDWSDLAAAAAAVSREKWVVIWPLSWRLLNWEDRINFIQVWTSHFGLSRLFKLFAKQLSCSVLICFGGWK